MVNVYFIGKDSSFMESQLTFSGMNSEGLSHSSAGKEPSCNSGDPDSIPGLGSSPGEGKGYPLQYSGLENSKDCIVHAEKAMAPHSSTLAWKIPWMEEPGGLQSMGSLRVGHD